MAVSLRWRYSANYDDMDILECYPEFQNQRERDSEWMDMEHYCMSVTLKRDTNLLAFVVGHIGNHLNVSETGRMPEDGNARLEGYFVFSSLLEEQEVRQKLKLPYGKFKAIYNIDDICYNEVVIKCQEVYSEGFFGGEAEAKRWAFEFDSSKDHSYEHQEIIIQKIIDFTGNNEIQAFVLKTCEKRIILANCPFTQDCHAHMFVVFKNPKSERQLESLLSFGRFQAATGFDHENYKAIIMKDCFNTSNLSSNGFF